MAHSNRKDIRESRGGLTKNQSAKAGRRNRYRSDFDAEARIRELNKWSEERNMKKDTPVTTKRRRHCMHQSVQDRRKKVILAREKQLVEGYVDLAGVLHMPTEADKTRINREISILKNRV